MNLAIIIPARNEAACIGQVLGRIPSGLAAQIIVVDNASTDDTAALARRAGAEVVFEPRRGYGRACLAGLAHLQPGIDAVAFLDADGSDDARALQELVAPIATGDADFCVGARLLDGAKKHLTPQQRFGNRLAVGLIWLGWGHRYSDLGPLRVIRREALKRLAMRDTTWGWNVEMQIRAVECGLRIREVPVPYRARVAGRSKIAGSLSGSVRAGAKILATIAWRWTAGHWPALARTGLLVELAGLAAMLPHGDFRQPGAALRFLLAAAVALSGYGLACGGAKQVPAVLGWVAAVVFRVLLLPMEPGDDIWRYLWEGKTQNLGFNVYQLPPNSTTLLAFRDQYWPLINNAHMPAIYPIGAQYVFRALSALWYHPLCFKLLFVLADIGTIWMLARLVKILEAPSHRVWWYAWNPLVIYAFAGGGHFDSLMLVCGLASLWLLLRSWEKTSVGLLGMAIAFKLVFLLAIPFYAAAIRRKPALAILVPFLVVIAVPYLNSPPHAWAVWHLQHYQITLAAAFGIGALLIYAKSLRQPVVGVQRILGWTLLLSPVYLPWYLTWVLALSPLVRLRAWWILSASSFAHFWLWHQVAMTGEWRHTAANWAWMFVPFYVCAGLEWWRWSVVRT